MKGLRAGGAKGLTTLDGISEVAFPRIACGRFLRRDGRGEADRTQCGPCCASSFARHPARPSSGRQMPDRRQTHTGTVRLSVCLPWETGQTDGAGLLVFAPFGFPNRARQHTFFAPLCSAVLRCVALCPVVPPLCSVMLRYAPLGRMPFWRRCRACEATPKAFDKSAQGCRACEATLGLQARQRSTLQRVARRVRKAWSEVSAVGPMSRSEEYSGHPGEPASATLQGFHRISACSIPHHRSDSIPSGLGGDYRAGSRGTPPIAPSVLVQNRRRSPAHTACNPLQG